jgi:glycosyltransferase involved in cell wall biosynthesis
MKLSLFFPAYNEEESLPKLLKDATRLCKEVADDYEIILVILETSKDNTIPLAKKYAKKDSHIRIVIQKANDRGVGRAYHIGFQSARYEIVMFSDADNQFDLQEFKKLLKLLPQYDFVTGYRKKRMDPFPRRFIAFFYNLLLNILYGMRVRDADCAMKAFKRELVQRITLRSRTGMICPELIIKARRLGYKIKEIPVTHYPRTAAESAFASGGFVKPKIILGQVKEMLALSKDLRTHNYDRRKK